MPEQVIDKINRKIFSFIWRKRHSNKKAFEKIKRSIMCSPEEMGGLNMINLKQMQDSFYIDWAIRLLKQQDENCEWTKIPLAFLSRVDGIRCFEADVPSKETERIITSIKSSFWKNVLRAWIIHKISSTCSNTMSSYIWNNKSITFKGKTLYFKKWITAGIRHINDLLVDGAFPTYTQIEEKVGAGPALMFEYNAMFNAYKSYEVKIGQGHLLQKGAAFKEIAIFNMNFGPRGIRKMLVEEKYSTPHCTNFWKRKLDITVDEETWSIAKKSTKETRLRVLHWKIVHNIYPTAILLKKMSYKESDLCPFCKEKDFIEHFFVWCTEVKTIWKEVEWSINVTTGLTLTLNPTIILTGYRNSSNTTLDNVNLINHLILIAKMCISKFKYGRKSNLVELFRNQCSIRHIPAW